MKSFKREAYLSAEINELFAGYVAFLVLTNEDGSIIYKEETVPCPTKHDAEEIIEKFLKGEAS
jgi:hypothetical protein